MDPVSAASQGSEDMGAKDVLLLRKSLDLFKQQANALINALPSPARSANGPGVGGQIDLRA